MFKETSKNKWKGKLTASFQETRTNTYTHMHTHERKKGGKKRIKIYKEFRVNSTLLKVYTPVFKMT